jgi:membrane protein
MPCWISIADALFGGAFTAALFAAGKSLIGLYLARTGGTSVFGAAASLVLLLLWVYYSAQILFFGAEVTSVLARRRRP